MYNFPGEFFPLHFPGEFWLEETAQENAGTLTTAITVSNKTIFVSDPGVLHLPPVSIKLS